MMKSIRFPLKERVTEPWQKCYVLIQAAISRIEMKDFAMKIEQAEIADNSVRLLKSLSDLSVFRENGMLLEHTIILDRALKFRAWDGSEGKMFFGCPLSIGTMQTILASPDIHSFSPFLESSESEIMHRITCSAEEARALRSFTADLAHAKLDCSFLIEKSSLSLQVFPSYEFEDRLVNNLIRYQLLCYNIENGKLLMWRQIPQNIFEISYSVPLNGQTIHERNLRCCLLSNFVGIDSVRGCQVLSLNQNKVNSVANKRKPVSSHKLLPATLLQQSIIDENVIAPQKSTSSPPFSIVSVLEKCDEENFEPDIESFQASAMTPRNEESAEDIVPLLSPVVSMKDIRPTNNKETYNSERAKKLFSHDLSGRVSVSAVRSTEKSGDFLHKLSKFRFVIPSPSTSLLRKQPITAHESPDYSQKISFATKSKKPRIESSKVGQYRSEDSKNVVDFEVSDSYEPEIIDYTSIDVDKHFEMAFL
jgi:hypothetical protein